MYHNKCSRTKIDICDIKIVNIMVRICIEIGKNDIKQQHYGNISNEKQK